MMSVLFLPSVLLMPAIPVPSVFQPLALAIAALWLCPLPLTVQNLLLSAGVTGTMLTGLRSAEFCVTDSPAGG